MFFLVVVVDVNLTRGDLNIWNILYKMEHLENRIKHLENLVEKLLLASNMSDSDDRAKGAPNGPLISIGNKNCQDSVRGRSGIAIGDHAGFGSKLGINTINIGNRAGYHTFQGAHSIAIGYLAGTEFQKDQSICLNASGDPMSTPEFDGHVGSGGFYVKPLRKVVSFEKDDELMPVRYNPRTGEFTYLDMGQIEF